MSEECLQGVRAFDSQDAELRECIKKHAMKRGYGNVRVNRIYGRSDYACRVDVTYDWVDPSIHVKEKDFSTTWFAIRGMRGGWNFEY